MIKVLKKEKLT